MELKLPNGSRYRCRWFYFNRTRWNWNQLKERVKKFLYYILIVPDGIETFYIVDKKLYNLDFNRTRWNWNIL